MLVGVDPGQDGLLASWRLNWVSPRGGKEEVHGFSDPSVSVLKPSFKILPPEIPDSGSLGAEYLPVVGGEFGPFIVKLMGVEWVSDSSGSGVVIIAKWIKSARTGELLCLVGEVSGNLRVGVRGIRFRWESSLGVL